MLANVDSFPQRFVNFVLNILLFVQIRNSFPKSYYKPNKCLASYSFTPVIRQSFFYISCEVY